MGYFLSDKEIEMDVQLLDISGDGEISFNECNHYINAYYNWKL